MCCLLKSFYEILLVDAVQLYGCYPIVNLNCASLLHLSCVVRIIRAIFLCNILCVQIAKRPSFVILQACY
jgi:hypothetical protein